MIMKTFKGHTIDFVLHKVSEIDISDIAHALSLQNRFAGHTKRGYSVAQHCVEVSRQVPREHALAALLHDSGEAYCGEVIRPVKRYLSKLHYSMEWDFLRQVLEEFEVDFPLHDCVWEADNRMLVTEMKSPRVYGHSDVIPIGAEGYAAYPGLLLYPLATPEDAETAFLNRYAELIREGG